MQLLLCFFFGCMSFFGAIESLSVLIVFSFFSNLKPICFFLSRSICFSCEVGSFHFVRFTLLSLFSHFFFFSSFFSYLVRRKFCYSCTLSSFLSFVIVCFCIFLNLHACDACAYRYTRTTDSGSKLLFLLLSLFLLTTTLLHLLLNCVNIIILTSCNAQFST